MSELDDLPESVRVKRWHATGDYAYPAEEKDDGEFVEYEDYKLLSSRVKKLERENGELRDLCGCAYQAMGVHDAPTKWMDALAGAKNGEPFTTEGLLPYAPDAVCAAESELAALKARIAAAPIQIFPAPPQVDKRHGIVHLNPAGRVQTKKRRPDVPLTNTLREALKTAPRRSAPYVNWHGEPVDSIRTAWRILRADAGLPAWFVPKVLRHTVATELRRRGVSGWEVSALLGHTKGDAAATTGRYAKYAPEWMQDSREALDALMADVAKKCGRLRELTSNPQAGTRK